jgi:hypothetical protein
LSDALADFTWLYRGVPRESSEVADVLAVGEVHPSRPDRIGERWRQFHVMGDTQTGYTSWTSDRDMAEEFAQFAGSASSGGVVIFSVRVDSIPEDRLFHGREDEAEFLIEGTVEDVFISESANDDEENSDA